MLAIGDAIRKQPHEPTTTPRTTTMPMDGRSDDAIRRENSTNKRERKAAAQSHDRSCVGNVQLQVGYVQRGAKRRLVQKHRETSEDDESGQHGHGKGDDGGKTREGRVHLSA